MFRPFYLSFVVIIGMVFFAGCADRPPEKTPQQLGILVETLPDFANQPYEWPHIEGHEDCQVTGEDVERFF